jgi:hypothetical protein
MVMIIPHSNILGDYHDHIQSGWLLHSNILGDYHDHIQSGWLLHSNILGNYHDHTQSGWLLHSNNPHGVAYIDKLKSNYDFGHRYYH